MKIIQPKLNMMTLALGLTFAVSPGESILAKGYEHHFKVPGYRYQVNPANYNGGGRSSAGMAALMFMGSSKHGARGGQGTPLPALKIKKLLEEIAVIAEDLERGPSVAEAWDLVEALLKIKRMVKRAPSVADIFDEVLEDILDWLHVYDEDGTVANFCDMGVPNLHSEGDKNEREKILLHLYNSQLLQMDTVNSEARLNTIFATGLGRYKWNAINDFVVINGQLQYLAGIFIEVEWHSLKVEC